MVTSREVTRPSQWVPELKGDLESILLKALRKDPQERYATVEQFADDLAGLSRIAHGAGAFRQCVVSSAKVRAALLGAGDGGGARDRQPFRGPVRGEPPAPGGGTPVRPVAATVASELFDLEQQLGKLPGATEPRINLSRYVDRNTWKAWAARRSATSNWPWRSPIQHISVQPAFKAFPTGTIRASMPKRKRA